MNNCKSDCFGILPDGEPCHYHRVPSCQASEAALIAADTLAKAARYLKISGHEECGDSEPKCPHKEIGKALAAYEKARGSK